MSKKEGKGVSLGGVEKGHASVVIGRNEVLRLYANIKPQVEGTWGI